MYHLLHKHSASSWSRPLNEAPSWEAEEPGDRPEEPEPETVSGPEAETEPTYTVIGEPVFSEPEAGSPITIILPVPVDPQPDEATEPPGAGVPPPVRRRFAPLAWMLAGMALVLVGVLVVTELVPWLLTSATLTIVPRSEPVQASLLVHLVTNSPDLARGEIQGSTLPTLTLSQHETVPTTGSGSQPAEAAHGSLTLYNALPAMQTIPAGTLVSGQDGIQITTDTTVTIPAANPPVEGAITASAHATLPGPAGNIAALNVNGPCCREGVTAQNAMPFSGGQDARSYQAVGVQDLTNVQRTLQATLTRTITTLAQAEVPPGASLLTPLSCVTQEESDHPEGAEATQVTVTVTETCQATAYDTAQMYTLVTQALVGKQRHTTPGSALSPSLLHLQVTESTTQPETLQVEAEGTLVARWSAQQQHTLTLLVAGKPLATALTLLHQQPGVATVSIHLAGRVSDTLPTYPGRIQVVVVRYG